MESRVGRVRDEEEMETPDMRQNQYRFESDHVSLFVPFPSGTVTWNLKLSYRESIHVMRIDMYDELA